MMQKLLVKKLIKNHQNVANVDVRKQYGTLAGLVGIITNAILSAAKIIIGMLFNSLAIIADGINNLTDASSSIITIIGFKMATKPSDEDHPYGHARIEYIAGLIVSVIIIMVGFQLLLTSIDKIQNPNPLEFNYIIVVILSVAILIKFWLYRFNISLSKTINSTALKATGIDNRNDVIATSAVLASIIIGYFADIQLDGYMSLLVSLFIIYSGIQLIRETSSPLLGQAPDPKLVEAIKEQILDNNEILGIHDLIVHDYGPGRVFASVHAEIASDCDIMKIHDVIDNIERDINKKLKIHLVIHMDPVDLNDPLVEQAKREINKIICDLEYVIEFHDLRVVQGITHHNLVFDVVVTRDCPISDTEIKSELTNCLMKINPIYRCVITVEHSFTKM